MSFDGMTLDICPGGVFIITSAMVPPKSRIRLELRIDHGTPLICHGEVIWINKGQVDHYPPGFGVQFIDLEESALAILLAESQEMELGWPMDT